MLWRNKYFIFFTESKVTLSSNFREDNIKDDKGKKDMYIKKIKKLYKIEDEDLAKDYLIEAWFSDKKNMDVDTTARASGNLIPWTRKANLAASAGFMVKNMNGKYYDAEPNFTHYYNQVKYKR